MKYQRTKIYYEGVTIHGGYFYRDISDGDIFYGSRCAVGGKGVRPPHTTSGCVARKEFLLENRNSPTQ